MNFMVSSSLKDEQRVLHDPQLPQSPEEDLPRLLMTKYAAAAKIAIAIAISMVSPYIAEARSFTANDTIHATAKVLAAANIANFPPNSFFIVASAEMQGV